MRQLYYFAKSQPLADQLTWSHYIELLPIKDETKRNYYIDRCIASLILLDINLKDGSGFDICKEIRKDKDIPISFISARNTDDDKIIALTIGGDDYIEKPYSLGVLLAKVKATLKRYSKKENNIYDDGNLKVDYINKGVYIKEKEVKLTSLEFKLLTYLIDNKNRLVTKDEIFDNERIIKKCYIKDETNTIITNALEIDHVNIEKCKNAWYNEDIKKYEKNEQDLIRIGALFTMINIEEFKSCLREVNMSEEVKEKIIESDKIIAREEGLKEGKLLEKINIAKNSLSKGIDIDTISQITGLFLMKKI